jgi:hypothetical protein
MKTKMKNLITITSIIVFSMIAIASSEDNSNVNNEEATEEEPMDYIEDVPYVENTPDEEEVKTYKCQWCGDIYTGFGYYTQGTSVQEVVTEELKKWDNKYCSRKCAEEYLFNEENKY